LSLIACSFIAAALAAASSGATVSATGTCEAPLVLRNRDYGGVILDASAASFPAGAVLNGVKGLAVRGGSWGRTDVEIAAFHVIQAAQVEDFSLAGATVLGNGDARGGGVSIANGRRVTVRDSVLKGHATAIGVRSSSAVLVTGNRISGSTADGINVTDVQQAIVSANSCRDFSPAIGAHPDCIQLRDLPDRPRQAGIWVLNNDAVGRMQAFFGDCNQATFAGNRAAVDVFTHTLTCARALETAAFDNVLSNTPASANGPGSLKGFDPKWVRLNLVWDARQKGWAPRLWSFLVPPIAGLVGSRFEDRSFNPPAVEVKAP
jgi:hypothetical protein